MLAKSVARFRAEETGSSLVELGLSLALLLTVVFGILDFSRALYADHYVSSAARDASRYAMVRGSSWNGVACGSTTATNCTVTSTDVTNYVQSVLPIGLDPSGVTVATTWPGTTPAGKSCSSSGVVNAPMCTVKVKVSYNFSFVLPFMPSSVFALTSTSAVAVSE